MAARQMRCDERDKVGEWKITLPRFPRECINNGQDLRTMKIDDTLDTNRTNGECRRGRFHEDNFYKDSTAAFTKVQNVITTLSLDFALRHLAPIPGPPFLLRLTEHVISK